VSEQPHLLVERDGHVLTLTMNRPESRNALSSEMVVRLADAWEEINSDDAVRVAILTGAGGHFSAGADLKAMAGGYGENEWTVRAKADPEMPWKALLRSVRLRKPLIAAVEGYAVAGGTEMLQATDIRVAGESARFGVSEARWGLFPLGGSAVRLVRQIPYTLAADVLLTGRHLSAREALEMGLIGHVVPDGEALPKALEIAEAVAANGPLAVRAILRTIRESEGLPEDAAFELEAKLGMAVFASEDAKEGPRAFKEKRPPKFHGR
jgi:enoyl-CoA hydratase